jgi:hypothetical protein
MAAHKNIKNTNVNLTENISNGGCFGPIIINNNIKLL